MRKPLRTILACLAAVLALALSTPASVNAASHEGSAPTAPSHLPVYAYFYQWFDHASWRRAKIDYPLAGRYSSSDRNVLVHQVEAARSAGLDGFLTSWKSTPSLDSRLQLLLDVAHEQQFDVGVVYEGLDFERHPLPLSQVRSDMLTLVDRWGSQLTSKYFGRPLIIWTGTDQWSVSAIRSVREALGQRAYLLASAKSAEDYDRVAGVVDGDAYYWSSANPGTSYTRERLAALSTAVHRDHGIWLAPATAGFDGRPLQHHRVVPRDGGQTLVHSLQDAFASRPSAVGVISWNEWSENTYIEPGEKYGTQELDALRSYLRPGATGAKADSLLVNVDPTPSLGDQGWTGVRAGTVLALGTGLCVLLLFRRAKRVTPTHRRG
jgi:hypothetical protein